MSILSNRSMESMVIDIGQSDVNILQNRGKRPKLIVMEGGMFWQPRLELQVAAKLTCSNTQPIQEMTKLAKAKGYELICTTFNTFFLQKDLYQRFANSNNKALLFWSQAFIHSKKCNQDFYKEIFQKRKTKSIRNWEERTLTPPATDKKIFQFYY